MNPQQIGEVFNSGLSRNEQIAELLKDGQSRNDIMKMMRCGPNIISKVKASLNLTGSAPPQAKIGRPTKKTPEVASFINQKTFDEPYITASDLKIQIKLSMDVSVSNSTLNNFRGEIGFKYLPPEHSPLLSDLQIKKRMNFCYSILLHKNELPFIGFSDESRFGLYSDKRWLWRKRGVHNKKTVVPQIKFPTTIMVWGMIGLNYKSSLFIFDETENAKNYVDMLNEKSFLLDAITFYENNFAFQQDGAPSHTAYYTMDALSQICDVIVNWPPNSPDLNCIEMLWALMKDQVSFYHPTNREELIEAVKIAWNGIFLETINRLCSSFYRRCFLCLENHGQCINHLLQKKIDHNISDEEIEALFTKLKNEGIILEEIEILKKKIE